MKKYKKIYIEITNICNLNCSFCKKSIRKKEYMSLDLFETILKKIKDYTDYIYLHVQGEPLLHPNIIEMIHLAEKYNLKVNLTTNGTLINKTAKELSKCKNLKKINFSLHSENKKDNYLEEIFDQVKLFSKDTTIIYRLWTLAGKELDQKSTDIVNKMKNYYQLSPETVEKIKTESNIKISSTIYVDKDMKFDWPEITNDKSLGYCYALKTQIAILVDGTVVPCCLDSDGIINLGNIKEESIEEIISSERYQKLKKSFQDRKPSEKLCQSCTYKNRIDKFLQEKNK